MQRFLKGSVILGLTVLVVACARPVEPDPAPVVVPVQPEPVSGKF
ncbi:MAG: hypothetical protein AAGE03_13215 [Pseudomonadota bacterium]